MMIKFKRNFKDKFKLDHIWDGYYDYNDDSLLEKLILVWIPIVLLFLLYLLVFFCFPVSAADPWDKQDIALETTWQILHVIDWGTTLNLASRRNEGYYELNPIIGRYPNRETVNIFMVASALGHLGATHLLPKKYRPWFQGITIGISGWCVINNFNIGLKVDF